LASNKEGWLTDSIKGKLKNTYFSPLLNKISIYYIFQLYKFIKNNNIDLIVCNSANAGFYGRICALIANIKSIYVSHGWSSTYNGGKFSFIFNKIENILSLITTSILCISRNDEKIAINHLGIKKNKIKVISNSIFAINNINYRYAKESNISIVTVCRLKYPKRVDLLIDAISKFNNVHLTIVGDGPNKNLLQKKINKIESNNITLLGSINGFDDFSNYDIFALISESEGLPISAIEAMSSGLALVLSNVGGCSELIRNNGIIVQNTVDEIIFGIQDCINKLDFYKSNSFTLYNEKFNLNLNKSIYLDYYNNILLD
jgi:glycosyltransferase involved in cell wall biosynthesis